MKGKPMKELVLLSGKGGTGKTSVAAALASLASRKTQAVFADCDVDAADLHLILQPRILERHDFISGREAIIDQSACTACGKCRELCRYEAVHKNEDGRGGRGSYAISGCEGCGVCVQFCPAAAISFPERLCGEWYESETRFGPLIHAQLHPGAENSGKLVTAVRKEARTQAESLGADWIIVDGCPGIGCPVIASITGADAILAIAEPSLSGKHDLERLMQLARHFKVPLWVGINKFDINPEIALDIKKTCAAQNIPMAGVIPYDTAFTRAQILGQNIFEHNEHSTAAEHIGAIWENVEHLFLEAP